MTFDEFTSRLEGVKRRGNGVIARCPGHEDREPSLGVDRGDDGRILLRCHAGCSAEHVVREMGLELRDLHEEPIGREPQTFTTISQRVEHHKPEPVEPAEAVYEYVDEKGELLLQVLRYPGKKFRQRRPDGNGGWDWSVGDVRRVPYRLPFLLEAIKQDMTVYFVEGEKDVESAIAQGKVATCVAGGANAWKRELAPYFRGAKVIIVRDKDAPGEAFAAQVYADLEGVAAGVWIVEAAEGKDLTDHLEAGKEFDELVPIRMERVGPLNAPKAVEWFRRKLANPPDPEDEGVRTPWPQILGTLRPGRFHLLGGYPADGKTAISLQFLKAACESGKRVDFFSIEMTAEELVERVVAAYGVPYTQAQSGVVNEMYRAAAEQALADIERWDFEIHDEPDVTLEQIEEILASRKSDLAVIDHVHAFGHKDRFEIEHVARGLKGIAKRRRVPMLVLAHLSRARKFKQSDSAFPRPDMGRLRESGMLEAWADVVWFVWRERDEMDLPTDSGELIVAKSRFTSTGYTRLIFSGRHQRWEGGH